MTAEEYANQQAIYAPMAAQFQSIFDMGPSQEGFSQAEKDALNAQAIEGTGTNYSGAAKAVREQMAGRGGGDEPVSSGVQAQMDEEMAASSAAEESKEETGITTQDYATGRANYENAATGLEKIAAGENPVGYEQAQTQAGSAASTTATTIEAEQNSWVNAALGAAGSIAGAAIIAA